MTGMKEVHSDKEVMFAIREFAIEDRTKSWFFTATTLLLLILLFVGSAYGPIYSRLGCSLLIVFVFVRMFVIYHDFLHHAILYRSKLAKKIFWLFGLFILVPFSIWQRSHDHHHKHNSKIVNGDIGPYPIMTKAQYLVADKRTKFRYLASRHPITILLAYFTMFLYGMCLQPFLKNPRRHYDCFIAMLLHFLFVYFLISTGGMTTFVLTLLLPFTMSFALGAYLFYVQHNFPDVLFLNKAEWSNTKAALESSSYLEMGRFMRWSTGNIGYHHIHHLSCAIPFYRLPEVMMQVPELQNAKKTSFHWRNVAACLRLKLWDTDKNKMITLNEI